MACDGFANCGRRLVWDVPNQPVSICLGVVDIGGRGLRGARPPCRQISAIGVPFGTSQTEGRPVGVALGRARTPGLDRCCRRTRRRRVWLALSHLLQEAKSQPWPSAFAIDWLASSGMPSKRVQPSAGLSMWHGVWDVPNSSRHAFQLRCRPGKAQWRQPEANPQRSPSRHPRAGGDSGGPTPERRNGAGKPWCWMSDFHRMSLRLMWGPPGFPPARE